MTVQELMAMWNRASRGEEETKKVVSAANAVEAAGWKFAKGQLACFVDVSQVARALQKWADRYGALSGIKDTEEYAEFRSKANWSPLEVPWDLR